jgi:hypothetical protein
MAIDDLVNDLIVLRSAGLAIVCAYIWHYCAYVIRVHWMPWTGMP